MIEEASEAEKKKILKSTNRLSALSQNLHINSNLKKLITDIFSRESWEHSVTLSNTCIQADHLVNSKFLK